MRKVILIICISFISISSFSQYFKAGILAGFSATQVDGDNRGGYNKFGIWGGGFVNRELTINKKLELQILYMQKGAKEVPNVDKGRYDDYFLNAHYLEFSLLYVYEWRNFAFKTGPMIDVYLSRIETTNGFDNTAIPNFDFRPVSLSFYGGVSYRFTEHFAFTGMFTYSLLGIRKEKQNGNYQFLFETGAYSNAVSFGLSYTF